ncbi:hypothetical protein Thiowin_04679 [Thiorhodovibrio winogradskyi]|uniref:Uncharacterized protein n=1 Tax=Thiorhodovibrio winogradskyi TaxID=77007 RepID=A0ABZ0SJ11_9GAMM
MITSTKKLWVVIGAMPIQFFQLAAEAATIFFEQKP